MPATSPRSPIDAAGTVFPAAERPEAGTSDAVFPDPVLLLGWR